MLPLSFLSKFLRPPLPQHFPLRNEADDQGHPYPGLQVVKHERAFAAHLFAVPFYHVQVSILLVGDVDLVGDKQVGYGDVGAALADDLIAIVEVDHEEGEVAHFRAEQKLTHIFV